MFVQVLDTSYEFVLGDGLDENLLADAFQHFSCSEGGNGSVKVEISLMDENEPAFHAPEKKRDIWYSGGQFDFVSRNLSGFVDLENRVGRFSILAEKLVGSVSAILRCIAVVETIISGGFVLHASCVVEDNCAYVFTGPSGSGKTTFASFADQAIKINDDTVLIAPFDDGYYVLGTPMWEAPRDSHGRGLYQIGGVFNIRHADDLVVEKLPASLVAVRLFNPPGFLQGDSLYTQLFENSSIAASIVPCYSVGFPKRADVFEQLKDKLDAENAGQMVV